MAKVLVIGGGGREHALVQGLLGSASRPEVIVAPGNAGIAEEVETLPIAVTELDALVRTSVERQVDLVVVGPEAPLCAGISDRLRQRGVVVFGPSAAAAELEGSKAFAKQIMVEAGVPTAAGESFEAVEPALAFSRRFEGRVAVKADGLAQGKGVVVAGEAAEAEDAIRRFLGGGLGAAGRRVVIEERLEGEELSVLALSDGERSVLLPAAQDHKRVGEGDTGPNTGGMGAYSPPPCATEEILAFAEGRCLAPVVRTMKARGTPFCGVLYAGLMLTPDGPRVLEYNVRFGDPEAQVILPRLDEDLYRLLLSVAQGRLEPRPLSVSARAALTIVLAAEGYPDAPRTGDAIEGLDRVPPEALVFHAGTRRDDSGRVITAGGRVLAVTGLGADLTSAKAAAERGVAAISWRGMHHRRDIGWRALGRPTAG
ncbi:MAG: phosphoribosylamine--glycine ligase [Deltaproteobacteria bacterium]|nr:phosphoribosylamine--glycine ligase [Deltaproteobacteria bacterium]